jgi:hypothetical protein
MGHPIGWRKKIIPKTQFVLAVSLFSLPNRGSHHFTSSSLFNLWKASSCHQRMSSLRSRTCCPRAIQGVFDLGSNRRLELPRCISSCLIPFHCS